MQPGRLGSGVYPGGISTGNSAKGALYTRNVGRTYPAGEVFLVWAQSFQNAGPPPGRDPEAASRLSAATFAPWPDSGDFVSPIPLETGNHQPRSWCFKNGYKLSDRSRAAHRLRSPHLSTGTRATRKPRSLFWTTGVRPPRLAGRQIAAPLPHTRLRFQRTLRA
jgi:hypothetical protein